MKKIFVSFLVILLSVSGVLAAPPTSECKNMKSGSDWYDCIVSNFLYFVRASKIDEYKWNGAEGPSGFLLHIIVPLVALFVITYGFMVNINIFGRRNQWINIVLTVLMVFITVPTGAFFWVVYYVLSYAPRYAFIIWAVLFVIGVWGVFRKTRARIGTESQIAETKHDLIKHERNTLKELMTAKTQLLRDLAAEVDPDKKPKISDEIAKINKDIDDRKSTIDELERQ